jgi:hypothetical protein
MRFESGGAGRRAAFLTKPFRGETILALLASFARQSPP